jgi:MerR family transcriptional regulator, heat shock protein HspR
MKEDARGETEIVKDPSVWSGGDGIAGNRGVFGISVAAELADVPVQSLRLFETRGLLEPSRTDGGTRRYSSDDVSRARHITALQADGLNLAGIAAVLDLETRNDVLAAENAALHAEITRLRQSLYPNATTEKTARGRTGRGRSRKK